MRKNWPACYSERIFDRRLLVCVRGIKGVNRKYSKPNTNNTSTFCVIACIHNAGATYTAMRNGLNGWIHWPVNDFVCIDNFLLRRIYSLSVNGIFSKKQEAAIQVPQKLVRRALNSACPKSAQILPIGSIDDRDTDLNRLFSSLLEDLMERLKQELFLSLQGFEFHFALYPTRGILQTALSISSIRARIV